LVKLTNKTRANHLQTMGFINIFHVNYEEKSKK